jgi:hypothetical protein
LLPSRRAAGFVAVDFLSDARVDYYLIDAVPARFLRGVGDLGAANATDIEAL